MLVMMVMLMRRMHMVMLMMMLVTMFMLVFMFVVMLVVMMMFMLMFMLVVMLMMMFMFMLVLMVVMMLMAVLVLMAMYMRSHSLTVQEAHIVVMVLMLCVQHNVEIAAVHTGLRHTADAIRKALSRNALQGLVKLRAVCTQI